MNFRLIYSVCCLKSNTTNVKNMKTIILICTLFIFGVSSASLTLPELPKVLQASVEAIQNNHCDTAKSKSYCLTEKQYILCPNAGVGIDARAVFSCANADEECSHEVESSCTSNPAFKANNTMCNVCSADNGFACTGYNTFSICENGTVTTNQECAAGLYCDTASARITNPCARYTGSQALCFKQYQAPPPPTDAEKCENLNVEGNHPVEGDKTCTEYLACAKDEQSGTWTGLQTKCRNDWLFDPETRTCVPSFMYTCPP